MTRIEKIKRDWYVFRVSGPIFFWIGGLSFGLLGVRIGLDEEMVWHFLFGYVLTIISCGIGLWCLSMSDLYEDMLYRMDNWRK